MTGESLRAHLREILSTHAVGTLAEKYGVQERERKLNVFEFVVALILAGGTHEGGRQDDILRTYIENGAEKIRRGTFYGWFTTPLLNLLTELLERAIAVGQRQPKLLPGILGGVSDWRVVDSTTIRLDHALIGDFPSTGDYAARPSRELVAAMEGRATPPRQSAAASPHYVSLRSRSRRGR